MRVVATTAPLTTSVLNMINDIKDHGQRQTLGSIESYLYGSSQVLESGCSVPENVSFAYEFRMMDTHGLVGYIKKHIIHQPEWLMLEDISRAVWEHHPVFVTVSPENVGTYLKDNIGMLPMDEEYIDYPILIVIRATAYSPVPFPQSVREYLGGQEPFFAAK